METFVSYVGEEEVIVCTEETESRAIVEFFKSGNRNIEDYNRAEEQDVAVSFSPVMHKN